MILINVLAVVAVATTAAALMLGSEPAAIDGATRRREAAMALAVARGGELSAVAALRRDADLDRDDRTEAWAGIAQAATPIAGGRFALAIDDAQGGFNVNAAAGSGAPVLAAIARAGRVPETAAARISAFIGTNGPIADLGDLARAGIDPATIAALRLMLTALPPPAPVNVNAAPAAVLGVLLGDRVAAARLVARRDRAGRLTLGDFAAVGVSVPAGAGFASDHFRVTATVTIGATTRRLTSMVQRRQPGVVAIIARTRAPQPDRET